MAKKSESRSYGIEVQKGPIRMDEQYSEQLRREPEHTMRDMDHLRMGQEKMTLTLHEPKS